MKTNIGKTDRIIRIVIGLALIEAGFYFDFWPIVAGLIGLGFVITGIIGFCIFYKLFGISTCKEGILPPPPPTNPAN